MKGDELEFEIGAHFKSSVQLATSLATKEFENASAWRWIVIAMHDAIYCALVMKLVHTDSSGIYPEMLEKEIHAFYLRGLDSSTSEWAEISDKMEKSKLADLATLLKRAKLASRTCIHKDASSAADTSKYLTILKNRRDSFVHAGDYSLLTTGSELREVCYHCVDVLDEILSLSGHRHQSLSESECRDLTNSLKDALRQ